MYDRAHEEATIVEHEMEWTMAYFKLQELKWSDRALGWDQGFSGHTSYALQQAAIYAQFQEQAKAAFMKTKNLYSIRSAT